MTTAEQTAKKIAAMKIAPAPPPALPPEVKGLLESKTFWGIVVMLFGVVINKWAHIDIDELTQSAITNDLLTMAGAGLAIWGRLTVTKKIAGVM